MAEPKNPDFRFNGAQISSVNKLPTNIDWTALQKNIENNKNSENRTMWGTVLDQSSISKEHREGK